MILLALLACGPRAHAQSPADAGAPGTAAEATPQAHALRQVGRELAKMHVTLSAARPDNRALAGHRQQLRALREALDDTDADIEAGFVRDRAHIDAQQLAEVIARRHAEALERYQARREELRAHLDALDTAADNASLRSRLEAAQHWLGRHGAEPARAPLDPENRPFRLDEVPLRRVEANPQELSLLQAPTTFARYNRLELEGLMLASVGAATALAGVTPPTAEDLAAAAEVQITPAIQVLAGELGRDPVAIYRWVHDHIEYVPSWGAAQTSAMVLAGRRGNAMDTASLLIALLRASGIPARYVHGTVRVASAQAMRWTGGFANPDAVQYFIGQGGIPNAGVTSGGEVKAIQMEHVWVEAWLDFFPSGGAINAAPDAWVPMDASYKTELDQRAPLDVLELTGIDALALAKAFENSGEVNAAEGWIRGQQLALIDDAYALTEEEAAQAAATVSDYFDTTYTPDEQIPLLESVRGIVSGVSPIPAFSGGLPYRVMDIDNRFAVLPQSLRPTLRMEMDGQQTAPIPVSAINGHQFELTAEFTTDEDFEAYASYLPDDPDPEGELPREFAPYLISLTPVLRLDGEVLLRGSPRTFGERYSYGFLLTVPGRPDFRHDAQVTLGSRLGFALVADTVEVDQIKSMMARVDQRLALLDSMTADELAEQHPRLLQDSAADIHHAVVLDYFLQQQVYARGIGTGAGAGRVHLLAGAASLGWVPNVSYAYGTPLWVDGGSIQMDAPLHFAITSADGATDGRKALARAIGAAGSWLEAEVPARYFTPELEGNRVSTSRLLHDALAAGQKIYHITSSNRIALGQGDWPQSVHESIANALNAGMEIVIHERAVGLADGGGTAVGFIVLDPANHAGAYLLDNGTNGSRVDFPKVLKNSLSGLDAAAKFCLNDPDTVSPLEGSERQKRFHRSCYKLTKPHQGRVKGVQKARKLIGTLSKLAEVEFKVAMVVADCATTGLPRSMMPVFGAIKAAAFHLQATALASGGMSIVASKTFARYAKYLDSVLTEIHDTCLSRPDQEP